MSELLVFGRDEVIQGILNEQILLLYLAKLICKLINVLLIQGLPLSFGLVCISIFYIILREIPKLKVP